MTSRATSRRHAVLALSSLLGLAALSACGGGGSDPSWAELSGSNAVTTLGITDTTVGTGAEAVAGKRLTVHYTLWLYDKRVAANQKGTKIESSIGDQPYSFVLGTGAVIKGWDQGLVGMKVGGKRTLLLPASLAYGSYGAAPKVPPDAALIFEVELLALQ
jgi:FKBP-type peptidyl-prolyl cis-trans isomerase